MPAKTIEYTDEKNGERYKISYSEELQLKNLHAAREHTKWLKMNFYAKLLLFFVMTGMFILFTYMIIRLDYINFFTRMLMGR